MSTGCDCARYSRRVTLSLLLKMGQHVIKGAGRVFDGPEDWTAKFRPWIGKAGGSPAEHDQNDHFRTILPQSRRRRYQGES